MLRVLYIHPFGAFGGATKSLCEMVAALPEGSVSGLVITPRSVAARSLRSAGLETIEVPGVAQWDDTRFGHYRGLRWLILLRELQYWPATLLAIRKAASLGPFDLIHCNEVTALLPALVAKRCLKVPLVMHVRSLQRAGRGGAITAWLMAKLRTHATAVVAIDEAVRRTLPSDLEVTIVHNGLNAPRELPPRDASPMSPFRVASVGVLHRSKGVYEFVRAARILHDRAVNVRLLVVGENIRPVSGLRGWLLRKFDFAADVRGELQAYVAEHGLQDIVEFTGFVSDIRAVYQRLDALCFPSHLDAPGRPVFEAALYGLPTVVAMRDPTNDVIIHGQTGLCIEQPTPEAIADAIQWLAEDRSRSRRLGEAARKMALSRFDSAQTALKMYETYRRICVRNTPDDELHSERSASPSHETTRS